MDRPTERVKARAELAKAVSHPTGRRIVTAVLRETRGFASLREEWDDLYQNCPSATPFQSWEWLYSWWEAYGEGYHLRLLTLREPGGLLVGLLPLMVRRGRLLLLGDSANALYWYVSTPYKDVLVRASWEEPVARAGARALKEMGGWRVADLQELMPQAAAWDLFRYWDGPKTSVPITDYLLMDAKPWEELLASLSRKLRKTARRTLRHAENDGVRCEPAAAEDAGQAARTLVDLHRKLWAGRRIDPEELTPRYEAFMEAAARRMSARGIGRISEFWCEDDEEVLVSQFLLFDKDFVGAYVIGASEQATRRYQLETLTNWDAMNVARSRGSAYVSLMFHASWDKLRWASEVVRSHRAILGRTKVAWVPYAGYYVLRERYYALRSDAQVYVHSDSAPQWIQNAMERYYALQTHIHSESAPRGIKSSLKHYYALRSKYGYGWLRYNYELARTRRRTRRTSASR